MLLFCLAVYNVCVWWLHAGKYIHAKHVQIPYTHSILQHTFTSPMKKPIYNRYDQLMVSEYYTRRRNAHTHSFDAGAHHRGRAPTFVCATRVVSKTLLGVSARATYKHSLSLCTHRTYMIHNSYFAPGDMRATFFFACPALRTYFR